MNITDLRLLLEEHNTARRRVDDLAERIVQATETLVKEYMIHEYSEHADTDGERSYDNFFHLIGEYQHPTVEEKVEELANNHYFLLDEYQSDGCVEFEILTVDTEEKVGTVVLPIEWLRLNLNKNHK